MLSNIKYIPSTGLPLFLPVHQIYNSNSHHVRGLPDNFFPSCSFSFPNILISFIASVIQPGIHPPKHILQLWVMYLAMRLYKQKDLWEYRWPLIYHGLQFWLYNGGKSNTHTVRNHISNFEFWSFPGLVICDMKTPCSLGSDSELQLPIPALWS